MTASVMSDDDSEQHHHRRTGRKTVYYTHRSLPSGSVPKPQLRRIPGRRGGGEKVMLQQQSLIEKQQLSG